MIMNTLNDVWSDSYILQTIIQKELQKLTRIFLEKIILETQNFQSELETFKKLKIMCRKMLLRKTF